MATVCKNMSGEISLRVTDGDGQTRNVEARGSFTISPTNFMKESDGHDISVRRKMSYVEGEIQDFGDLSVFQIFELCGGTVTLSMANGKVYTFRDATYIGDGEISTENGRIPVRFESPYLAEEILNV